MERTNFQAGKETTCFPFQGQENELRTGAMQGLLLLCLKKKISYLMVQNSAEIDSSFSVSVHCMNTCTWSCIGICEQLLKTGVIVALANKKYPEITK